MPSTRMLPDVSFELSLGQEIYDILRGGRLINRYARESLREQLIHHHQTRIPKHFRLGARETYSYAPRKPSYLKEKRLRWRLPSALDLVRSKNTSKSIMQRGDITFTGGFGGVGSPGTLQGRLTMYLPHAFADNRTITAQEIKNEITATTYEERLEIAHGYVAGLVQRIRSHSGPMRKVS